MSFNPIAKENPEIATLKEIRFSSETDGRIECKCYGDKISANDAAWNALYLQMLLRFLTGIAIPKASITLVDTNNETSLFHSHIGQPGLESGLDPNTIIPRFNLGLSCEKLCTNPEIIRNWMKYCYAKNTNSVSLISICLNNTPINERVWKLTRAFDSLSSGIDKIRLRFNKTEFKKWKRNFCTFLEIPENEYGVTRDSIENKLGDFNRKSLKDALADFIGGNKKELSLAQEGKDYLTVVKYISDYRNAMAHGGQIDIRSLPKGYDWYELFLLMYKVDLLLIKKYILKNDLLFICEHNDFRFIFESFP